MTKIDRESVERLTDDELLAQLNAFDPYDDEFRRRYIALRAALDEAEARAARAAQEARAAALQEAAEQAKEWGAIVDHPNVYMGGPSRNAQRIAKGFAEEILVLIDTPAKLEKEKADD